MMTMETDGDGQEPQEAQEAQEAQEIDVVDVVDDDDDDDEHEHVHNCLTYQSSWSSSWLPRRPSALFSFRFSLMACALWHPQ